MKELLISLGFKMFSSCSCGGTYAEKYKKSGIVIEIKPKRNVWSMKINGTFTGKGTADNFTEKLTQHGIII
jgi:hypothetical protein